MKPPEDEIRQLVSEWIRKADLDHKTVLRLSPEGEFRDIAAFHAQQAAEQYLKPSSPGIKSSSRRRMLSNTC